jgi:uncharacterized protein YutE (UPF0331/DUF86 family)
MNENERLKQLENNCAELAKLRKDYTVGDLKDDKRKEWALRYGLFESLQIVIDISCHIVVKQNLGQAGTYVECIELLHKFDIISGELKDTLKAMTGLRNILVHEYVSIDIERLYNLLNKLSDFEQFAGAVSNYIR